MKPEPSRIEPIFSPRLWGARSLAPLFPEKSNLQEPLGEAWLTGVDCLLGSGPFAGRKLGDAWKEMPTNWRGKQLAAEPTFPILVKFIFPMEKLSLQVHPDDAYAAIHEKTAGGRGKTEMWHAVSAAENAELHLGLKPGVNREKFLMAMAAGTLEDLYQTQAVKTGDTFFVSPGTQHSIGPNLIMCEVQEYSDLTYRVYDFGRRDSQGKLRELHTQKALDVTNFGNTVGGKVSAVSLPSSGGSLSLLAACRYFATEKWECSSPSAIKVEPERFEILVVLHGEGDISWADGNAAYRRGECWLIPASLGSVKLVPEARTSLIRTYLPNLAELRAKLRSEGIAEATLAQVIFD